MTILTLFVVFYGLVLTLGVGILWIKSSRPPKEDPRLSRGLQLLQSKISVLEDLSDRTERQVKQLMALLDERAKILQSKILQAHETMHKIEQSMAKSLDVAQIFQDKIPHEEIIERQNAAKFVTAAKMAHQGRSIEDIMAEVDLPRAEVEFISKVNRDELTFSEAHLPDWAKAPTQAAQQESRMTTAFATAPSYDLSSLKQAEENFRTAVTNAETKDREFEVRRLALEAREQQFIDGAKSAGQSIANAANKVFQDVSHAAGPVIKKVQFPRIGGLDR